MSIGKKSGSEYFLIQAIPSYTDRVILRSSIKLYQDRVAATVGKGHGLRLSEDDQKGSGDISTSTSWGSIYRPSISYTHIGCSSIETIVLKINKA